MKTWLFHKENKPYKNLLRKIHTCPITNCFRALTVIPLLSTPRTVGNLGSSLKKVLIFNSTNLTSAFSYLPDAKYGFITILDKNYYFFFLQIWISSLTIQLLDLHSQTTWAFVLTSLYVVNSIYCIPRCRHFLSLLDKGYIFSEWARFILKNKDSSIFNDLFGKNWL